MSRAVPSLSIPGLESKRSFQWGFGLVVRQPPVCFCSNGAQSRNRIALLQRYVEEGNSGLNPVSLINTLPPGSYTINVTDASGCLAALNIPILSPDSLEIEFVATDVQCFGENNGSLSAIASGGTPLSGNSYTYLWSPNNQTSFNISNCSYHRINNIFQNDKYIKYSQTNMKSIVRGGIDD